MKKFIKGRWFPLVVATGIIATTAFVMVLLGWRVTYAPELENSWEAISACAAWAGVVASFIAIWFAIQVPKTIANRQDRISLFEKRYQVYNLFMKLYATMNVLKHTQFERTKEVIAQVFDMYFDIRILCEDQEEMHRLVREERDKIATLLHSETNKISILFPVSEDCEKELHCIISNLYHSTMIPDTEELFNNTIKMFDNLVDKGLFDTMRQELNIF